MTIYLEQALITNFVIDYCILLVISKILFAQVKFKHTALSALFGSVASLVSPYCFNTLLANALKVLTSIIMLQILKVKPKQIFAGFALMLGLSYVIGGAVLSNFATQVNGGYALHLSNLIPVFATTIITTLLACQLIGFIKAKITTNCNIYDTKLVFNNRPLVIKGFIDSGNGLQDNNQPVSLINFDTFTKLTGLTLTEYLNNQLDTLTNPHCIRANTIAGSKKILVFTIDELQVNNKVYKNAQIGVSLHFDNTKEYKAILNSSFCFN